MMIAKTARRAAGISLCALVLVAGCKSTEDRSSTDPAFSKEPLASNPREGETLKRDLDASRTERDRLQKQLADSGKANDELQSKLRQAESQNEAAQGRIKSLGDDLAKAKAELEGTKKSQEDSDQAAARLKAAEDGVTAARVMAADADRGRAAAVEAAEKAKAQAKQLTEERDALQKKVKSLTDELAKRPTPAAVPDLNK